MHSRRDSLHQQEQWYNFLKGIRARFKNEFLSRIVHFCKISLTCCQYFSFSVPNFTPLSLSLAMIRSMCRNCSFGINIKNVILHTYEKTPHFVERLVLAAQLEIHIYPEPKVHKSLNKSRPPFLVFENLILALAPEQQHVFQSKEYGKIVPNRALTTSVLVDNSNRSC